MKTPDTTKTDSRLRRLGAGMVTAGLLAGLMLISLPAAAQNEEKIDYGKISQGRSLYRAWCRSCHGDAAKGDGPMAESLRVRPADLTLLSQKDGGQFYFGRVMAKIDGREDVRGHGSKDMPIWGEAFEMVDEEAGAEGVRQKIDALAHYLRSLQVEAKK